LVSNLTPSSSRPVAGDTLDPSTITVKSCGSLFLVEYFQEKAENSLKFPNSRLKTIK
jgi:hypothetical protein